MKLLGLCVGCFFLVMSCNQHTISNSEKEDFINQGREISNQVQMDLLKNLTNAINDSGFVYAIQYCQVNALKITNTELDGERIISIQRLSDRNRNPENSLSEPIDIEIFQSFKAKAEDTLLVQKNEITYYRPIKIIMPTCLKCHGNSSEIEEPAAEKIRELYPNDLAKNYQVNELRGMWKIKITR